MNAYSSYCIGSNRSVIKQQTKNADLYDNAENNIKKHHLKKRKHRRNHIKNQSDVLRNHEKPSMRNGKIIKDKHKKPLMKKNKLQLHSKNKLNPRVEEAQKSSKYKNYRVKKRRLYRKPAHQQIGKIDMQEKQNRAIQLMNEKQKDNIQERPQLNFKNPEINVIQPIVPQKVSYNNINSNKESNEKSKMNVIKEEFIGIFGHKIKKNVQDEIFSATTLPELYKNIQNLIDSLVTIDDAERICEKSFVAGYVYTPISFLTEKKIAMFADSIRLFIMPKYFTNKDLKKLSTVTEKKKTKDPEKETSKRHMKQYSGFYAGLGISGTNATNEAIREDNTFEALGCGGLNVTYGGGQVGDGKYYLQAEMTAYEGGNEIIHAHTTINNTAATVHSFKTRGYPTNKIMIRKNDAKLNGSIVCGYGAMHKDIYLGGELNLDCGSSGKSTKADDTIALPECSSGSITIKKCGIAPTVAARIGLYNQSLDALLYLRAGAEYSNINLATSIGSVKLSKLSPIIGVGVEKKLSSFSFRVECDYKIKRSKIGNISHNVDFDTPRIMLPQAVRFPMTHSSSVNVSTKGYTVRTMICYHL